MTEGEQMLDPAVFGMLQKIMGPRIGNILNTFIGSAGTSIAEMQVAAAAGDVSTLFRLSHRQKGAAGQLGATKLHNIFEKMENLAEAGDFHGAAELVAPAAEEFARLKEFFATLTPATPG